MEQGGPPAFGETRFTLPQLLALSLLSDCLTPVFLVVSTELSLITLHWFLTAFASVVHIKLLLRLWDLFFYEGSLVLFQATLGMLRLKVRLQPHPPRATGMVRATLPSCPRGARGPDAAGAPPRACSGVHASASCDLSTSPS